MSKTQAHISPFFHRGGEFIKVKLSNTDKAKNMIRSVTGRKWSQTHLCWYVPKTAAIYAELKEKFEVIIENEVLIFPDKVPTVVTEKHEITPVAKVHAQPEFIEFKYRDGKLQKRMIGDKIILAAEKDTRFKVFVPFDKKGWIVAIKEISGRAWNVEENYWSIPYVKDSFRRIWALGKENILLTFEIRTDIADDFAMPKKLNLKTNKPQIVLGKMQQAAITALEERFILENKAFRTIRTYKYLFKKFLHFYSGTKPSTITAEQIRQYLLVRKKQDNISDSQYNQLINTLNAFYCRILKQEEKVVQIERPKKKRKLPNILSIEDVGKLIECCSNLKHKTILILVYSGGLRKGELLQLRVTDIDFQRKTVFIKNGKGGKDRYTFLSDAAQKYLKKYLQQYNPKYYLFEGQTGGIYSEASIQRVFEKARFKSQVSRHITLHGLRHSFATHLVEKGVPLHIVQDLLGHYSIKTTEIYLHISNKFRKDLRSPLDDLDI